MNFEHEIWLFGRGRVIAKFIEEFKKKWCNSDHGPRNPNWAIQRLLF